MKRYLVFLSFVFFFSACKEQVKAPQLPSYATVAKHFFDEYGYEQKDLLLEFSKRPDGWYVQETDMATGKVHRKELIWSLETKDFEKLSFFGKPTGTALYQLTYDRFMRSNGGGAYAYERCALYGYPEWARDMIATYGEKDPDQLQDTLLDGLARAYESYGRDFANSFATGSKHPLQQKLEAGEKPGKQRLDSMDHYFRKSCDLFDLLAKKYPGYETVVGNAAAKSFNQKMHAFLQFRIWGDEARAKQYLQRIESVPSAVQKGKSYLDACAPNTVLFTYGDNDSYPLWYVQEKEGYRKDVTVINTSLAALPEYLAMLQKYEPELLRIPVKLYEEKRFTYAYAGPPKALPNTLTLDGLLRSFEQSAPSPEPPLPLPETSVILPTDTTALLFASGQSEEGIWFRLGQLLDRGEIAQLDIIQSNYAKRPIAFTGSSRLATENLQQEGMIQTLTSRRIIEEKIRPEVAQQLEAVLSKADKSVEDGMKFYDGLAEQFYMLLSKYYSGTGNTDKARKLADSWLAVSTKTQNWNLSHIDLLKLMGTVGNKEKSEKLVTDMVDATLARHYNPMALKPYFTTQETYDMLDAIGKYIGPDHPRRKTVEREMASLKKELSASQPAY